jgi:hypothetical protein
MPTKEQLQIIWATEMEFPFTRREDDPMYSLTKNKFMTDGLTTVAPAPTLGEERVRISFNTQKSDLVTLIKQKTAELIDLCEQAKREARNRTDKNDNWKAKTEREFDKAQEEYESAAHWAVKGATAGF